MGITLPLGVEFFTRIREEGYYYVDKTAIIREILNRNAAVDLITRPRRFGKTLTMQMLEDFFDISRDSKAHFEGLEISKDTELCEKWMNQYPTIMLSLKSVEALDFETAYARLRGLIADLCAKYTFLKESPRVDDKDREKYLDLYFQRANVETVSQCFQLLSRMLHAHYGKPVILLIDEYDVPLAKASENGYYREMMDVIRAILGNALKTNPDLQFAVVTGCLRIAKESIFTGLNNMVVDDIIGSSMESYIGFTQAEVSKLLADTGFSDHEEEIRRWYDGYRFGDSEMYCPWSVLNHVAMLRQKPNCKPRNYWANTSHNGVIYQFIDRKRMSVRNKFDILMAGGNIVTPIEENLTYDYISSTETNFWSLLYLTGYLTMVDEKTLEEPLKDGFAALRIPNEEVKSIFKKSIIDWFNDYVVTIDREQMYEAFWNKDITKAQELLANLLFCTISYYDYGETYYHAFLAGLFAGDEYEVDSNYEYGTGRPDIVIRDNMHRRAIVFEAKYSKDEHEVAAKTEEALQQFAQRRYMDGLRKEGYTTVIGYAVVFYAKNCEITMAE